jgi:hypothetical protein
LDLFELFDLEVKGQSPTKVIMVRDTPPYGHAYTNYLSMNSFVRYLKQFFLVLINLKNYAIPLNLKKK